MSSPEEVSFTEGGKLSRRAHRVELGLPTLNPLPLLLVEEPFEAGGWWPWYRWDWTATWIHLCIIGSLILRLGGCPMTCLGETISLGYETLSYQDG